MDIMDIYDNITDIDLQFNNVYPWFNYGYPELYAGKTLKSKTELCEYIIRLWISIIVVDHKSLK